MRGHRLIILALVLVLLPSAVGAADPELDRAVARLERGLRVRVKTTDYLTLRGRFLYAPADSLYLHPRSYGPDAIVGLERDQISELWTVGRSGIGNGLLWAGGAALLVTAIGAAGAGTLSEGDLYVAMLVAAVTIPFAFFKGYRAEKETLAFERRKADP